MLTSVVLFRVHNDAFSGEKVSSESGEKYAQIKQITFISKDRFDIKRTADDELVYWRMD